MSELSQNIIEEYLKSKGLEYKAVQWNSGVNFRLKRSPIHWSTSGHHFYINAVTGLWDDKKTGDKWNFNQLREMYGDDIIDLPEQTFNLQPREYKKLNLNTAISYAQNLHAGTRKDIIEYLMVERWFSKETLLHFKIGVCNNRITIPIIDKEGELVNIRSRKDPKDTNEANPRYMSESWCKSILFNESIISENKDEIWVCEWEFDAMTLWQNWIKNVVSVTLGAGNFLKDWVDQLEDIKQVNIIFDSDEAGIKWANHAKELLGDNVRIITLPSLWNEKMDVSDFFTRYHHTLSDFMDIVNAIPKPAEAVSEVKHISEYNEELRKRLTGWDYKGISTWYEKFDSVIGGLRKWRVITLSWLSSVGKTSASVCLSLSLSQRNIPNLFITTEMSPVDIYRKFLLLQQKLPWRKIDTVEENTPIMDLIDRGLRRFKGDDISPRLPLYLMDSVWQITINKIVDVCKIAVEKEKVEVIFIDHLHYFATTTKNPEQEISNSMKQIKKLALSLDIPIVLLAHIWREWRSKQRRWLYIPTMADLKGSSAIEQDSDQIVFVCRDSEHSDDNEKRKSVWKVSKNRDGATGHTSMDFDMDIWFFSEVNNADYLKEAEGQDTQQPKKKSLRVKDAYEVFWY